MAENSNIEWTDHTFNPWIGCTKVSPGCDNCYAAVSTPSRAMKVLWGVGEERHLAASSTWKQPVKWDRAHGEFFASHGRRQRVFCASLADVFDNEVSSLWRAQLFALIAATPNLDWLLLTKRVGNAKEMIQEAMELIDVNAFYPVVKAWPWSNVWLGATIINQEEADRDIPKLLGVPAAKRFLSMEPLLGPVDLWPTLIPHMHKGIDRHALDWVIVGGESRSGARPMHPGWAKSLRDQCAAADVPFLFKQWGEYGTKAMRMTDGQPVFRQFDSFQQWVNKAQTWINGGICLDRHGTELKNGADMARARDSDAFPVTIMHKLGKKAAGRLLDGVLHDGVPGPVTSESNQTKDEIK